jgi:hypothetical protein
MWNPAVRYFASLVAVREEVDEGLAPLDPCPTAAAALRALPNPPHSPVHVGGWEVKQQRWDRDKGKRKRRKKRRDSSGRTSNNKERSGDSGDGVGDSTR